MGGADDVASARRSTARAAVGGAAAATNSANLDILRSAAVSFVVLFHLALFFGLTRGEYHRSIGWGSLGHWGVLIFFVHTSLVLMRSIERLHERQRDESLFVDFIVRRAFRLLPLSVLAVVVVGLLRMPVGHLQNGAFLAAPTRPIDVVANLLLVQNLADVEPIEAPLWSLPYEAQMYLALPLLYAFVRRQPSGRPALALWAAAALFGALWERHPVGEMPAYVPCFLAGVVAFKLPRAQRPLPYALWPVAMAILTLAYTWEPSRRVGWGCCLALGLAIPRFAEWPASFVRRACQLVARYSYGVYLSHFVLMWFAFVWLEAWPWALKTAIFLALLVAVPVGLYHCVEAPMIRIGGVVAMRAARAWVRPRPLPAAVAGGVALAVVATIRVAAARWPEVLGLGARPDDPGAPVRLEGRFDTRDPAGPRLAWPGSALVVAFAGTGLDIRLKDFGTNFFSVRVDGGPPTVLSTIQGAHVYALASGLPPGRHEVVVTKRTEASVGVVQYLGVAPHDGALVASSPALPRRIEYVGDSFMCGYGVLGGDARCPFSPDTEDETIGVAALAASALGARATVLAYSGKGMVRDWRGSTEDPVPALFRRTLPDDPSSAWGFDEPPPDAVVIDVGTNDFELGDPGPAFGRAYVRFLQDLRERYPGAQVLCAVGPMLTEAEPHGVRGRAAALSYLVDAVRQRRAAGDARVDLFVFDEPAPRAEYGCENHPGRDTHRAMAAKLAARLGTLLDWPVAGDSPAVEDPMVSTVRESRGSGPPVR